MVNGTDFDLLWEDLGSLDLSIVQLARNELIRLGSQIAAPLLAAIETGTIKQIANAVIVMGEIGDVCFETCLCDLLKHHQNIVIRSNAAKMLGNFSSEQAVNALISKLEHDNEMVTMWIAWSLGQIGGNRAKQALIHYLDTSPSHTMCYMTIRALGDIGDADLASIIEPYLTHDKHHVRNDAQLALEKIRKSTT